MKKLSLLLVFVMALVCVLAFSTFAATANNVASEAVIVQDGSNSDLFDFSKLVDGDYNTACTGGDKGADWTNFHFKYSEPINITKVVIVVKSTGTNYNISKNEDGTFNQGVYDTLSPTKDYKIYFRLYAQNGTKYSIKTTPECSFRL